MNQTIRRIVLPALLCATLLLSSCTPEMRLVGTWQGDGSLDMASITTPYEFATQMVFHSDGTAVFTINENDVQFTFHATDDTLTLSDGSTSWGFMYHLSGRTLTFLTGGNTSASFIRS